MLTAQIAGRVFSVGGERSEPAAEHLPSDAVIYGSRMRSTAPSTVNVAEQQNDSPHGI